METVKIEIITIGDEILIGQIVDTNSAWMAVELNKHGMEIVQITSVHDDATHIIHSLNAALTRADAVLITGGIGPTKDDITKQTLCRYFDTDLVFSQAVYDNIERLFKHRPNVMNPLTAAQAMVPRACTVLQNEVGTAPLTWFEHKGKIVVSMPGVPYEMKHAMTHAIIPRLCEHFKTPKILHKTTLVYGIPESQLAIRLTEWEDSLPSYLHLAYLPNNGLVKLRLSGTGDNHQLLAAEMQQRIDLLPSLLGNEAIVGYEDCPFEVLAGQRLRSRQQTLATAESCTGGNIAHLITSVAGSSDYYKGSIVAYDNHVKEQLLGIPHNTLINHGAVSQVVVEQMAQHARQILQTDYAIATSGIAGPTGGTQDKPVGMVWIAVASPSETISKEYHFGQLREQNINRATQAALYMLLQQLR